MNNQAKVTRAEIADEICMVYHRDGNAFDYCYYTPEALREMADKLEEALGEASNVTTDPSPFLAVSARGETT